MPIAAVRKGETLSQEFEDLYLEHCQLVYRTAYAITGNRQDAEDVLQRIFVKLLERRFSADVLEHPARVPVEPQHLGEHRQVARPGQVGRLREKPADRIH